MTGYIQNNVRITREAEKYGEGSWTCNSGGSQVNRKGGVHFRYRFRKQEPAYKVLMYANWLGVAK